MRAWRFLGISQAWKLFRWRICLPNQGWVRQAVSRSGCCMPCTLTSHVVSPARLAEEACQIEIDILREPIGKQDQYIAAFGGLQLIQFLPDGRVTVDPVVCGAGNSPPLNSRLLLFYTGLTYLLRRFGKAEGKCARQASGSTRTMRFRLPNARHPYRGQDLNQFGKLLGRAWQVEITRNADHEY